MLFAEKYVDADWNAAKEFVRREGIAEEIIHFLKIPLDETAP